jgi:hypothetical protein
VSTRDRDAGKRSFGAALRVNVFGFAVVEVDSVRALDRRDKGGRIQLGFTPGF